MSEFGGAPGDIWVWLERSALARGLRASEWLYPGVEIAHIVGFTSLVGSIALFDARLLGAAPRLSITLLGRYLRRWSLASVALVVPSGSLLFVTDAAALAHSTTFRIKLLLIALGALNALGFDLGIGRSAHAWDREVPAPWRARCHGAVSLCTWVATLACGRLLAYT